MVILDDSTVRVSGSFVEPTKEADGVDLVDLAFTTVYYSLNGAAPQTIQNPASSPNGGGTVEVTLDLPLALSERLKVEAWVTATDLNGLESVPTETVTLNLDRVAPAAPTNFSLA